MGTFWQMTMLDDSDPPEITGPSVEDAETFQKAAEAALASIAITDVSKTDLGDSCGVALYPCAQKIIPCAASKLVKNAAGAITPTSSACNCFSRGFTEPIAIPGKTNAEFSCDFDCVSDLLKFTTKFVADTNGPSGSSLTCDLSNIAAGTYGNAHGYIPTGSDSDPLENMPEDDPLVERAAEAVRINFNSERLAKCPALKAYDTPGKIEYAKRGMAADGSGQYKLEVVFGNDVVYARIAHLPERKQTIDPTVQSALDDPDNLAGQFSLVSSVPHPCDDAVPEQLAVSAAGSTCPILGSREYCL